MLQPQLTGQHPQPELTVLVGEVEIGIELLDLNPKLENIFSIFLLPQSGQQISSSELRTSDSNLFSHFSHLYSNSGTYLPPNLIYGLNIITTRNLVKFKSSSKNPSLPSQRSSDHKYLNNTDYS